MPNIRQIYRATEHFNVPAEPSFSGTASNCGHSFVIQKHWATRLHYDLRLELNGVMKSWAIPKGPSLDSKDRRLAIQVEDHSIAYNTFEGEIPAKQYGAGKVIVWDKGTWEPIGNPTQQYAEGHLKFKLDGHKLHGLWALVRMKNENKKRATWLLVKEKDTYARSGQEYSVIEALPDSVANKPNAPKEEIACPEVSPDHQFSKA